MDTLIGYKVVRISGGKLYSVTLRTKEAIAYCVGTKSFPRKGWGPLAVFSFLPSAIKFSSQHSDTVIYKCKYRQSNIRKVDCPMYGLEFLLTNQPFGPYPIETDFADWVMLLERMQIED